MDSTICYKLIIIANYISIYYLNIYKYSKNLYFFKKIKLHFLKKI